MIFFKTIFHKFLLIFIFLFNVSSLADNHDKNASSKTSKEEPLPLNDPFVGDSSFSGGVQVITSGETSQQERKKIDLFTYKLVGIIISEKNSLVSLVNKDGETINLAMFEELNEGVKLVDMNDSEAIFQTEDSYLIMNFKNQIRETNEY
tara:strand:- start:2 stop:448 length:447 start_codon:yes stop_codon:yes gene_type:complete